MLQIKNRWSDRKSVFGFSIILILKWIMTIQSQRVRALRWTKNTTLMKAKRNRKWKIRHSVLEARTLCFSSYKNSELRVKLRWVGTCEKKESIFSNVYYVWKTFFNISVLSWCIGHWTNFQNVYVYVSKNIILQTFFYLFLKSSKTFTVSLKNLINPAGIYLLKVNNVNTRSRC